MFSVGREDLRSVCVFRKSRAVTRTKRTSSKLRRFTNSMMPPPRDRAPWLQNKRRIVCSYISKEGIEGVVRHILADARDTTMDNEDNKG